MLLPGGSTVLVPENNHVLKVNLGCQTVTKCCREGAMAPKGLSPIPEGHCQGGQALGNLWFLSVPGQMAGVSRLRTSGCEILHPVSFTRPSLLSPGSPRKL